VEGVESELVSGGDPCSAGKIQENSPKLDAAGEIRAEFSEYFHGGSDRFPVIENREFGLTNREIVGNRSGL
jgi:hypothetical protein